MIMRTQSWFQFCNGMSASRAAPELEAIASADEAKHKIILDKVISMFIAFLFFFFSSAMY
jgi:hypothetical protein